MTFTTVIDNLYVPYQPKLSAETIAKIMPLVKIWTSFNKIISDYGKAIWIRTWLNKDRWQLSNPFLRCLIYYYVRWTSH